VSLASAATTNVSYSRTENEDSRSTSNTSSRSPSPLPALHKISRSSSDNNVLQGYNVAAKTGGDRFYVSIGLLNVTFSTCLFIQEKESKKYNLDNFLPNVLADKGRLPIEEFNKFIFNKTKHGKSTVAVLKLSSIFSEDDVAAYKKFYKEYEAKKRIAMFSIREETKLFLVTPKFISAAKCLNGRISSRTSTYAVVLTKENVRREL